jgi:hypothetical protein
MYVSRATDCASMSDRMRVVAMLRCLRRMTSCPFWIHRSWVGRISSLRSARAASTSRHAACTPAATLQLPCSSPKVQAHCVPCAEHVAMIVPESVQAPPPDCSHVISTGSGLGVKNRAV